MSLATPFHALVDSCRAHRPDIAIVLGSGLGSVAEGLVSESVVPYQQIPGMAATAVTGHRGVLSLGDWTGRRVLLFEGRNHYYEGHPWSAVVRSVELAHELGARQLLLTNASGGIHPNLGPGDVLLVGDHMEWTYPNWWQRPGPGCLAGDRPTPYSAALLDVLHRATRELGFEALEGIYCQVTGPCYETPAEIRAMKACGADAVGMSTAREIDVGHTLGMECAAVSCVANRAAGLGDGGLSHAEVIQVIRSLAGRLRLIVERFLTITSSEPDA